MGTGVSAFIECPELQQEICEHLGARTTEADGIWAAALFLRSVVAVESIRVLVERDLVDDAAVIVRTLSEIELQLGAIKHQPQLRQDSESKKYRFNSSGSLLSPEYVMALAAATQLNIVELVLVILAEVEGGRLSELRSQNGAILGEIKQKGL